ncbi:unnamed protein product [Lactuca saligna]|uniref:Conserved oligomeric Golgi complex subunit 5 helical domain-containing protein n=1 Tax=Lactuca saligna TaxID=75948 RepID=A0AA36E683_LACSI|nr:unnamed protein product [Lactuca saligna]
MTSPCATSPTQKSTCATSSTCVIFLSLKHLLSEHCVHLQISKKSCRRYQLTLLHLTHETLLEPSSLTPSNLLQEETLLWCISGSIRVLSMKRDPYTLALLLDEVMQEGDSILTTRVWEAIVKSFANQMKSTQHQVLTKRYSQLDTQSSSL